MTEIVCTFEDCGKQAQIKGRELCRKHYLRLYKTGRLRELGPCSQEGCDQVENFRGLCVSHRAVAYPGLFKRWANAGKGINVAADGSRTECSEVECSNLSKVRGLCGVHAYREVVPAVYESPNKDEYGVVKKCKSSEDCDRDAISKGFCYKHWERVNKSGSDILEEKMDICAVEDCSRGKLKTKELCSRCNQLSWRYSIPTIELLEMHLKESRVCGNPGCLSTEKLHVDHDHACCGPDKFPGSTKVSCGECVRGWLCASCNTSLGMLQENPRRIQGLLDYLKAMQ